MKKQPGLDFILDKYTEIRNFNADIFNLHLLFVVEYKWLK